MFSLSDKVLNPRLECGQGKTSSCLAEELQETQRGGAATEKRNTEVTKNHRVRQRNSTFSFRGLFLFVVYGSSVHSVALP
jgi:hypothetical protein